MVPGITGAELANKQIDKVVWFNLGQVKDDDLRLPLYANFVRNRDNLYARDILREAKLTRISPDIEIYQPVIGALKIRGYVEGDWDNPKATDVFYVFAYDWRRSNVKSARQLIEKIKTLKAKIGNADLKFDVLTHSMGGLAARYAAMYGKAICREATRNSRRRGTTNGISAKF